MKVIKLQFYPRSIYLSNNFEEFKKHIRKEFVSSVSGYSAATTEYMDYEKRKYYRGVIIYINVEHEECKSMENLVNTISHESLHAVNIIFQDLNIKYNIRNDEHAAYLLGFIAKECYKYFVSKINKK